MIDLLGGDRKGRDRLNGFPKGAVQRCKEFMDEMVIFLNFLGKLLKVPSVNSQFHLE